jgi:lipid-A-disaccharide synthase
MLEAAQHIRQQRPEVQFVIPLASSLQDSPIFAEPLPPYIHLIRRQTYETINAADAIVTASGTVTVETAILETPMIITYIVSPLTYWLGRRFIKVPFIGMVNLIAGKQVVPELIQQTVTPERIAEEVLMLLQDTERLLTMKQELRQVHQKLGEPGAADRAAETIAHVVETTGLSPHAKSLSR